MKARLDGLAQEQADGNLADDKSDSGLAARSIRKRASKRRILTGNGTLTESQVQVKEELRVSFLVLFQLNCRTHDN